jgi:hypothetical protein
MGFIRKVIVSCFLCSPFLLGAEEFGPNEALNEVVRAFEKKIEGKFGLTCCGSGARMPHDIQSIDLDFETTKTATLEEARKVGVFFMEQFLATVNSDEKIRPYLREYPFTPKRVFLTLCFQQEHNRLLYVFLVKNEVVYKTRNGPLSKYVEVLREPYEEAKQIARKK